MINEKKVALIFGIRKAKGKFVLITNPDLLFNDDLINYLSKRLLDRKTIYRVRRCDLEDDIPENLDSSEKLEFCRENYKTCCGKNLTKINYEHKNFHLKYKRYIY